jgi:streptogramin lyase
VLEFGPRQLTKGFRKTKPVLTLNATPAFTSTQGVVFDSTGNLWVIDGGATAATTPVPAALDMFTSTQLKNLRKKKSRAPAPTVTLTCTCFVFPQQAVFDSAGNLWVSDNANGGQGAVDMFAASLLTTSGAVTPTASFTSTSFTGPLGIAFGSNGNLWIANNGGTTIVEFDKGTLPTTGTTTLAPNVILSTNANSIEGPWALAFDTAGNLWSSNANSPFTLVEFASTDLTASGSPAATITINPATIGKKKSQIPSLNSPNGISFDNSGGLGVANSASPFSVVRFSAAQLATGGTIVPIASVTGTALAAPAGDNFGPLTK